MAVPGGNYNGWWKDNHNNRLYFYQAGTAVGYIDGTSGMEILTGSLNVSGGLQVVGGLSTDGASNLSTTRINGAVAVSGVVTFNDPVTYADTFQHASRHTLTLTGGAAITISSCGSVIELSGGATASSETFVMPDISADATNIGSQYTFVNNYPDSCTGTLIIDISDSGSFVGGGIAAVSGKDLINPISSHKHGDYVTIRCGDVSTWFIMGMRGAWETT